jgi:hypothetical protein
MGNGRRAAWRTPRDVRLPAAIRVSEPDGSLKPSHAWSAGPGHKRHLAGGASDGVGSSGERLVGVRAQRGDSGNAYDDNQRQHDSVLDSCRAIFVFQETGNRMENGRRHGNLFLVQRKWQYPGTSGKAPGPLRATCPETPVEWQRCGCAVTAFPLDHSIR